MVKINCVYSEFFARFVYDYRKIYYVNNKYSYNQDLLMKLRNDYCPKSEEDHLRFGIKTWFEIISRYKELKISKQGEKLIKKYCGKYD